MDNDEQPTEDVLGNIYSEMDEAMPTIRQICISTLLLKEFPTDEWHTDDAIKWRSTLHSMPDDELLSRVVNIDRE